MGIEHMIRAILAYHLLFKHLSTSHAVFRYTRTDQLSLHNKQYAFSS